MVAKIEMTAEDVAEEVRRYSILVGFLLIVVFVVPCVGFALLSKYCQKQRRKRRHRPSVVMQCIPDEVRDIKEAHEESTTDSFHTYGTLGQVECPLESFETLEKVCTMGACLSCLGPWKAIIPSVVQDKTAVGKLVLVRRINAIDTKAHIPCLKADIATLSHIPPHPFLLNLLGVCNSGGVPQALMLEYPLHGSLHSFLVLKRRSVLSGDTHLWPGWTRRNSHKKVVKAMKIDLTHLSFLFADNDVRCHPYAQPLNSSFTDIDLLLFTLQIASAMEHLSQRNILHKGLSSENLMIGPEFYLKLTGIHTDNANRHKEPAMRLLKRTASGRNLFKWDAPEVMEMGQHTEKTEVWRFGMTVWEVTSLGDSPFADTPNRTLSEMVRSGQRPQAPECCSRQLYQLMMECWDLNPNNRPTFSIIVERIQSFFSFSEDQSLSSEQSLAYRRPSRGRRSFLHSSSSSSLMEDTSSVEDSPVSCSLPSLSNGPLSIGGWRNRTALDLEEIPEDCLESDI